MHNTSAQRKTKGPVDIPVPKVRLENENIKDQTKVQVKFAKMKNKVKEVLNELQQLCDPTIPIHMLSFNEFQKLLDDPLFHSKTMQRSISGVHAFISKHRTKCHCQDVRASFLTSKEPGQKEIANVLGWPTVPD